MRAYSLWWKHELPCLPNDLEETFVTNVVVIHHSTGSLLPWREPKTFMGAVEVR